jgi:hypothetical protein
VEAIPGVVVLAPAGQVLENPLVITVITNSKSRELPGSVMAFRLRGQSLAPTFAILMFFTKQRSLSPHPHLLGDGPAESAANR